MEICNIFDYMKYVHDQHAVCINEPIISNAIQGDKESITFVARYWFGSGNHTYIEWVGSDGSTHWDEHNSDPMRDFLNDYS